MAKSQKRSNREIKKPKMKKEAPPTATSPFPSKTGVPAAVSAKKKKT